MKSFQSNTKIKSSKKKEKSIIKGKNEKKNKVKKNITILNKKRKRQNKKQDNKLENIKAEIKDKKINEFNEDNKNINNELNQIYEEKNDNKLELFHSFNPKKMVFLKNLVNGTYFKYDLNNTFTIFNSIFNIPYLIYGTKYNSIISYNLNNDEIINEVHNVCNEFIFNFIHFLDKKNKRDLLLTISDTGNIKIWNIYNWEIILDIYKPNISSSCFLNDINKNEFFIITNSTPIKIYDIMGNDVKKIKTVNLKINVLDVYYDKKLKKNFIITGNNNDLAISYDYENNKIYHKYCENECKFYYRFISDIKIGENNEMVNLFVLNFFEGIKIWNFHSGELIKAIGIGLGGKYKICLWNNEYLFVGFNNIIKLININTHNNKNDRSLAGHKNSLLNIQKCVHPIYGECLISQGVEDDDIKLWIIKK